MQNDDLYIKKLITQFKQTVSITPKSIDLIKPCLEIKQLAKKEFLLQPGQTSKHMRFVAEGSLRSYYLDADSQEHILQLGIENWWVNDLYSYLAEKPSNMFVQAIEKSVIVQISKSKLEFLFEQIPELSNFFRIKIQNAYVALQERTMQQISADAYERYSKFRLEYRDIEQRIPQYMIASYLGITPEFLSYLRKKHASSFS